MSGRQRFLAVMTAGAIVFGVLSSAPSPVLAERAAGATQAGRSTPELIESAVASGQISRETGDVHLAHAFADYDRVPAEYRSDAPWEGTVPLLQLRQRAAVMKPGPARASIEDAIEPAAVSTATCSSSTTTLLNTFDSTHFHVAYSTIGGGLALSDYVDALETSWAVEVTSFGWAAPPVKTSNPPPGNRYHVRIDNLGGGLYGFVSSGGTHAGPVGNNPNTAWNDVDAQASCMVLNRDFSGFPSPPLESLQSTAAHEFNHSLQYGYGALNGNVPDSSFIEGGASWMEDEVFDASNDSYFFLWPNFQESLGDYDGSPYPYWITYRGLTERYGSGVAGGAEQVMQDFWEGISQGTGINVGALANALAARGTTVADAFHAHAIAAKFLRTCGGGYVYPYCFEEAAGYLAGPGPTAVHKTIASPGGSTTGLVEDDYGLQWVQLPAGAGSYNVTLTNTSAGGQLRGSVVCDTGSTLAISAFPAVVAAGTSTTVTGFSSAGCTSVVAVLSNQAQSAGNPSNSAKRAYSLSTTGGGGGTPAASIGDASTPEGNSGTTLMSFPVTLSGPSASTVTVNWATSSPRGGATAGADYVAASGTVTFAPGDVSETIGVAVVGNTIQEPDEPFNIALSNPVNATIADGTATGTILNDDGGGGGTSLSISDASIAEGDSGTATAVFNVTLSAPAGTTVTVAWSTSSAPRGASAGSDYVAASGTVTFVPGDTTEAILVTVNGDNLSEPNETFKVTLSNPTNATISDGVAVGTIVNDD